jgi:hypothetical protein
MKQNSEDRDNHNVGWFKDKDHVFSRFTTPYPMLVELLASVNSVRLRDDLKV